MREAVVEGLWHYPEEVAGEALGSNGTQPQGTMPPGGSAYPSGGNGGDGGGGGGGGVVITDIANGVDGQAGSGGYGGGGGGGAGTGASDSSLYCSRRIGRNWRWWRGRRSQPIGDDTCRRGQLSWRRWRGGGGPSNGPTAWVELIQEISVEDLEELALIRFGSGFGGGGGAEEAVSEELSLWIPV